MANRQSAVHYDPAQVQAMMDDVCRGQGIMGSDPVLDLFPDHPIDAAANIWCSFDGFMSFIGMTGTGAHATERMKNAHHFALNGAFYRHEPRAMGDLIDKHSSSYRLFAGIHEIMHGIGDVSGTIFRAYVEYKPSEHISTRDMTDEQRRYVRAFLHEEMADAATTLFVMSRFPEPDDLNEALFEQWAWRAAAFQTLHATGDAIRLAMQTYAADPRPGLTPTDALTWVEELWPRASSGALDRIPVYMAVQKTIWGLDPHEMDRDHAWTAPVPEPHQLTGTERDLYTRLLAEAKAGRRYLYDHVAPQPLPRYLIGQKVEQKTTPPWAVCAP